MSTEAAQPFFTRVWDELQRSLTETFGIFSAQENGLALDYAALFTRLLVALIIVLLFALANGVLQRLVRGAARRFGVPLEIVMPVRHGLRYMVILIGGLAVLSQFGLSGEVLTDLGAAALLAFTFYVVWLVASKLLSRTMRLHNLDKSLEQLVRNILGVLVIVFALVTVLGQFGIQLLSIITTLGVVGIAVGFAAQDTLSNFISGITLLVERPFRIGDWIQTNDQIGQVQEITLRTTRILTRDNIVQVVPNAKIASDEITNLSAGGPLRNRIPVGIAYKESARAARDVMMPILQAHDKVMKSPGRTPQVWMVELGDSSVNLILLYWLEPADIATQPKISAELLEACKEALDQAGIEIPFPHLQLFIDDAKGLKPVLEPIYRAPRGDGAGEPETAAS